MEEKYNIINEGHETPQQNASTNSGSITNEDTSLDDIESKIKTLESEINNHFENDNSHLKGYMAEDWARGTFYIDAAIKQIGEPDEKPI